VPDALRVVLLGTFDVVTHEPPPPPTGKYSHLSDSELAEEYKRQFGASRDLPKINPISRPLVRLESLYGQTGTTGPQNAPRALKIDWSQHA